MTRPNWRTAHTTSGEAYRSRTIDNGCCVSGHPEVRCGTRSRQGSPTRACRCPCRACPNAGRRVPWKRDGRDYFAALLQKASVKHTTWTMMSNRRGSKIAYQFKVRLKQRRSIWRSIVLRGDQTLDALHEVIFAAFERNDEHLYSFFFPNGSSRRSFSERRAKEYTAPQGFFLLRGLTRRPDSAGQRGTRSSTA